MTRIDAKDPSLTLMLDALFDPEFFDIHEITRELARSSAEVARIAALRGSDAVYVALASHLDVPLVSWDNQQRERGGMFCRTMTPVEAMEMAE